VWHDNNTGVTQRRVLTFCMIMDAWGLCNFHQYNCLVTYGPREMVWSDGCDWWTAISCVTFIWWHVVNTCAGSKSSIETYEPILRALKCTTPLRRAFSTFSIILVTVIGCGSFCTLFLNWFYSHSDCVRKCVSCKFKMAFTS